MPVRAGALASLPEGVSADLRTALEDGFNHLWELVQERCDELRAEQEQQDTETETVETITETRADGDGRADPDRDGPTRDGDRAAVHHR